MTLFESILLGAVQGITEFLPVSSSGHLVLVRDVFGITAEGGLTFDLLLHLATLFAVLLAFRKIIFELLRDAWSILTGRYRDVTQKNRRMLLALIVGTVPAAMIGFFFERVIETSVRESRFVIGMLIIGSALLIAAERDAKHHKDAVDPKTGWRIGWFQVLALLPGFSRSGATISGGMLLGLNRTAAAEFSFLLSMPIIAGSALKKILDMASGGAVVALPTLTAGFLTAFLVGWLTIRYFMKYLAHHTLYAFAAYRLALAALMLVVLR